MFPAALSEEELLYGVTIRPAGRWRNTLGAGTARRLNFDFGHGIVPFDSAVADTFTDIGAGRRCAGRLIGEANYLIANISYLRGAVLVTRKLRDVEGTAVDVLDPWTALQT